MIIYKFYARQDHNENNLQLISPYVRTSGKTKSCQSRLQQNTREKNNEPTSHSTRTICNTCISKRAKTPARRSAARAAIYKTRNSPNRRRKHVTTVEVCEWTNTRIYREATGRIDWSLWSHADGGGVMLTSSLMNDIRHTAVHQTPVPVSSTVQFFSHQLLSQNMAHRL